MRDKYAYNLDKDAELDWVEPSLHLSNSRALQPYGPDRVYDAFHLLQTDPSIQVRSLFQKIESIQIFLFLDFKCQFSASSWSQLQ